DTLIPRAMTWSLRTRTLMQRLLRQVVPVLRELVTEVLILDRELRDADNQVEELRAVPAPVTVDESTDPHARLAAAHALVGRLVPSLTPAPTRITVESYQWQDMPTVEIYAWEDADALTAWAAQLGAEVTSRTTSAFVYLTARCTVDGIPVLLNTSSRVPVQASAEVTA
ncbi:hypothetical protein ACWC5I_28075, partial [Kitasatospora sp. NPDC001574]